MPPEPGQGAPPGKVEDCRGKKTRYAELTPRAEEAGREAQEHADEYKRLKEEQDNELRPRYRDCLRWVAELENELDALRSGLSDEEVEEAERLYVEIIETLEQIDLDFQRLEDELEGENPDEEAIDEEWNALVDEERALLEELEAIEDLFALLAEIQEVERLLAEARALCAEDEQELESQGQRMIEEFNEWEHWFHQVGAFNTQLSRLSTEYRDRGCEPLTGPIDGDEPPGAEEPEGEDDEAPSDDSEGDDEETPPDESEGEDEGHDVDSEPGVDVDEDTDSDEDGDRDTDSDIDDGPGDTDADTGPRDPRDEEHVDPDPDDDDDDDPDEDVDSDEDSDADSDTDADSEESG